MDRREKERKRTIGSLYMQSWASVLNNNFMMQMPEIREKDMNLTKCCKFAYLVFKVIMNEPA